MTIEQILELDGRSVAVAFSPINSPAPLCGMGVIEARPVPNPLAQPPVFIDALLPAGNGEALAKHRFAVTGSKLKELVSQNIAGTPLEFKFMGISVPAQETKDGQ